MSLFKHNDFNQLSTVHDNHCVSIYIPTHRKSAGGEGMEKDRIHLKNQLKEATKQLEAFGMKDSEANEYLKPISTYMDDLDFWLHQSDGLAIFYHGDEVRTFELPLNPEPFTYVNDHYYLKPLANLLHDESRHYILNLSLQSVTFYEATKERIAEVKIDDFVPQEMRESVGYDVEEKHLQQRTGQGENAESGGLFHGHGVGNESEKKEEAFQHFQKIDDGLMKLIKEEQIPLVVACVDYLFPIFKKASSYKYIADQNLDGNYEDADLLTLKEKAWEIVKDDFEQDMGEAEDRFKALVSEGKSSSDPSKLVPASVAGRMETLFLKKGEHLWGRYIEKDHKIQTHQVRRVGDTDLLDLASTKTIAQGGKVYQLNEADMPTDDSYISGIFRYDYSS